MSGLFRNGLIALAVLIAVTVMGNGVARAEDDAARLVVINRTDASLHVWGNAILPFSKGVMLAPHSEASYRTFPGYEFYTAIAPCVSKAPKVVKSVVVYSGKYYEVTFDAADFGLSYMVDAPHCDDSTARDHQPYCSFAGDWKTSWTQGEGSTTPMHIDDKGTVFDGTYDWKNGHITGTLQDGTRLVGEWRQDDGKGTFDLQLKSCDHWEGTWEDPINGRKGEWFGDRAY